MIKQHELVSTATAMNKHGAISGLKYIWSDYDPKEMGLNIQGRERVHVHENSKRRNQQDL